MAPQEFVRQVREHHQAAIPRQSGHWRGRLQRVHGPAVWQCCGGVAGQSAGARTGRGEEGRTSSGWCVGRGRPGDSGEGRGIALCLTARCNRTGLTGTLTIPAGLRSLGKNSFSKCPNIVKVVHAAFLHAASMLPSGLRSPALRFPPFRFFSCCLSSIVVVLAVRGGMCTSVPDLGVRTTSLACGRLTLDCVSFGLLVAGFLWSFVSGGLPGRTPIDWRQRLRWLYLAAHSDAAPGLPRHRSVANLHTPQ